MLQPGVRLTVLPIHLSPVSSEYDPSWHADMQALVRRPGAEVIPIGNGSGGQARFRRPDQLPRGMRCSCRCDQAPSGSQRRAAARCCLRCPLLRLGGATVPDVRRNMVVVARSTAALHAPEDLARIAWEREGLYATAEAGGHIAAISGYMRHHLTTAYGIPGSALISLTNGLTRADWHTTPPGTFELTCPPMNSPQLSNGTPAGPTSPKRSRASRHGRSGPARPVTPHRSIPLIDGRRFT